MAHFPAILWLAFTAIGAASVIAFLYYLAVTLENEARVAKLKLECAEVRKRYARQLQQAAERNEIIEVAPIDEAELLAAA